jgi:magnesium transporter
VIRALCFPKDSELHSDLQLVDVAFALHDVNNLIWVDFENSSPDEDEPVLRKTFGFHPLAIDDALQESHVPRLDDWGQYLYVVLHAVAFDPKKEEELDTLELDIFVGKNYVVTHHDEHIEASSVWKSVHRDERHLKQGLIICCIASDNGSQFMPVIERWTMKSMRRRSIFTNPKGDPDIFLCSNAWRCGARGPQRMCPISWRATIMK